MVFQVLVIVQLFHQNYLDLYLYTDCVFIKLKPHREIPHTPAEGRTAGATKPPRFGPLRVCGIRKNVLCRVLKQAS